jgi:D-alanyl-D-alanine carboxypeptidase/D-alanyl-D-alanine-endopeptidase (penicillin-binding protein 4)
MNGFVRSGRRLLGVVLLQLALGLVPVWGAAAGGRKQLAQRLNQLVDSGENAQAFWGVSAVDLGTGTPVLSLNAERMFVPASIQKLITGYAAWTTFGPAHRFRTEILTDGTVDDQGILHGNLIVRGGGDPSWSYRFFEDDFEKPVQAFVAELLRQTNLRGIQGDVVADDTVYLTEPYAPAWTWEDFQWAYGVRISSLGFNDNVMALVIGPDAPETPATYRTYPDFLAGGVHCRAVARSGAVLQDLISFKPFDADDYYLAGASPATRSPLLLKMAVSDPAALAGRWIAQELRRRGVAVSGAARVEHRLHYLPAPRAAGATRTLAVIEGLPLNRLLEPMMQKSINPLAEVMLRNLGVGQTQGTETEREAGIRRIYEMWPDLMKPGVNVVMQDGSGLSRQNLLTPRLITGLLARIHQSPDFEAFRDLLSVSGSTGTLKNRLGGKTADRVYAKTGKLGLVLSMAGFVHTQSGRWLAFCIVANNHPARRSEPKSTIDAIVKLLNRY